MSFPGSTTYPGVTTFPGESLSDELGLFDNLIGQSFTSLSDGLVFLDDLASIRALSESSEDGISFSDVISVSISSVLTEGLIFSDTLIGVTSTGEVSVQEEVVFLDDLIGKASYRGVITDSLVLSEGVIGRGVYAGNISDTVGFSDLFGIEYSTVAGALSAIFTGMKPDVSFSAVKPTITFTVED